MPLRPSSVLRRGHLTHAPWLGRCRFPAGPKMVGGVPIIRGGYTHFRWMKPERPPRSIGVTSTTALCLYNRLDQIAVIENALALQRAERQIEATLSQLSLGIRNAENFLEKHLIYKEVRPSLHALWFHEGGLRSQQHILSTLAAHHLVPLFSILSYDLERGKMSLAQSVEVYEELMDCAVAQPRIAQRELANQMIRCYCLKDEYDKALEVVDEMQQKGIRRTFVTYAPLFRMTRAAEDGARHVQLLAYMHRAEGGPWAKFLYIDVPRMLYMWGVFIRYNWVVINFSLTAVATCITMSYAQFGVALL